MIDGNDAVLLSGVVLPHQRVKGSDTGVPSGQPAIPPPISAHDGLRPQGPLGFNQILGRAQEWGPTALLEAPANSASRSRGLGGLQATNLAVAQAVEHEGQELSSHCHPGLELAASGGDAVVVGP